MFQGVAQAGQPTILASPSSSNPAGDLIVSRAGLVSGFFAAGLVSAAVNSHYGTEMAVQIEYAPLGVPTGLCAALATPPDLRTLTSAANPSLRRSESAGVIEWRAV